MPPSSGGTAPPPRVPPPAPIVPVPAAPQPTSDLTAQPPISSYEAGRRLKRQMGVAGGICGLLLGLLAGIGGPSLRELFDDWPNVVLGTLLVVLVLAGPWVAWNLSRRRVRLILAADADDLVKAWLIGAFGMVMASATVLIVLMALDGSSRTYAQRHFGSWAAMALLGSGLLVVAGAVLDMSRRRGAGVVATSAPRPGPATSDRAAATWVPTSGGAAQRRPVSPTVDAAARRAYVAGGLKLIAFGVGILVVGGLLTVVLSALFQGMGTVVIATGALAVGLVNIVRGAYYILIRGFIL
jgi:hypothetical protein